jgi:hypothetical protein
VIRRIRRARKYNARKAVQQAIGSRRKGNTPSGKRYSNVMGDQVVTRCLTSAKESIFKKHNRYEANFIPKKYYSFNS